MSVGKGSVFNRVSREDFLKIECLNSDWNEVRGGVGMGKLKGQVLQAEEYRNKVLEE